MDCQGWQKLMDDYLARRLAPGQLQQAEEHLASCPDCRRLLSTAQANLVLLSEVESRDLTQAILEKTSGPACARAQDRLGDLVEGTLPAGEMRLVRNHLEHCPDCQALAVTLTWLLPELKAMASLAPPAGLTAEVMNATVKAGRERLARPVRRPGWSVPGIGWRTDWAGWQARGAAWLNRQLARPQFSLQAAYVGMLLLIALFGTPISPLKQAPQEALAMVQATPGAINTSVLSPVADVLGHAIQQGQRAWDKSGGVALEAVQTGFTNVRQRFERAQPAAASTAGQARASLSALLHADLVEAARHLDQARASLRRCWQGWRHEATSGTDRPEPSAGRTP